MGLDHYFAGHFDQAIDVWTRVAFLDRGHDRARAYIDRARTAIAEQHREAEELLHLGIDAFNRGDTEVARDLINRAVEQVGPHDLAVVFLERLNRLGSTPAPPVPSADPERGQPAASTASSWRTDRAAPSRGRWVIGALVVSVAVAGVVLAGVPLWLAGRPEPPQSAGQTVADEPLPMAHSSEVALMRARELADGGHLHDALERLDRIDIADAFREEADRLRGDLQRRLLDVARPPIPVAVPEAP